MKRNHRDGTAKGRDRPKRHWAADLKWDARKKRRQAERRGLHGLRGDPAASVVLPARNRNCGDPWSWD